ncbi:hypothetical protein NEOC84_001769|uniref:leucine-rich repeat domain-containing protein n=1 Tax=Neochlamydia sp. AcF84 TaxID=2315858 RepID=UPI0014094A43|nr:hypothetical protein [Neochlamydia sp. AcF84]NGY95840.1 hypothetical protein [Neochlamydia sp. AcF84]
MLPATTSSTQTNFRTLVSENIEDPVSRELMTQAVTLVPCGHTFNEDTIIQCLAQRAICPLDRQPIKSYVPNYTIRQLAEAAESHPLEEIKQEPSEEAVKHFLRGKELYEKGNNAKAIEALLQAIELSPAYEKAQAFLECCLNRYSSTENLDHSPQAIVSLYNKIVGFHFPHENGNFTEQASILDRIYKIDPSLSIEFKVNHIFKQILTLAESLSPLDLNIRNKRLTFSSSSSYILNINRLLLWQKLPGGKEYLNRDEIKTLSIKKQGRLLKEWMRENCEGLLHLDLGKSGLTFLPPEIGLLSQLKTLELDQNQLTTLPEEIGQLSQLQLLGLSNNQLTSLPAAICQLSQLHTLALSYNQLTYLPARIGQLTSLQRLYLGRNQLAALPSEIGNLSQLKILDLVGNHLSKLPTEIGQLPLLQRLYLQENLLTTLTAAIWQLSQLQSLRLSHNQLNILPTGISQLSELQSLDLSHNKLNSFPAEISQLASLQRLNLTENPLTEIPSEVRERFRI